jgi:hypothetical protein
MEKYEYEGIEIHPEKDSDLLCTAFDLLESDLRDPKLESKARATLRSLRKRRYKIVRLDLENPDCLICLYTALECVQHLAFEPGEDFETNHNHDPKH